MKLHPSIFALAAGSVLLALTACKHLGPKTVAVDRFDYSAAIADSWKQQTLLNIVKIRLGLTVESLNGVRNRSTTAGTVREADPEFVRALQLMREMPPTTYAARRKGTQRLRCSMGRCSRRSSLKAAFRWWYQDAPVAREAKPIELIKQ